MQTLALLKLMNLVSPALPVGAYAYSQGQEWAVDDGWIKTEGEVEDWINGVLTHSVARLDIPCLLRCFDAWKNQKHEQVQYWNQFLIASRETHELLLEDEQLGQALSRLLISLEISDHEKVLTKERSFACLFALAGVRWGIPLRDLAIGFAWSWLENQVAAATKIVPLGQTQAQQMLQRLMNNVESIVDSAMGLEDDEIGAGLPALAIASSLHERQYSRLFRS